MNRKLLLKLAALPRSDQKWVLKQLTPKQQEQFHTLQGKSLLNEARRFRKLPCPESTEIPVCQELKQQDPLYRAIILEQGQFDWEKRFIEKNELSSEIRGKVRQLKPATKLCVFEQWQAQFDCNGIFEL